MLSTRIAVAAISFSILSTAFCAPAASARSLVPPVPVCSEFNESDICFSPGITEYQGEVFTGAIIGSMPLEPEWDGIIIGAIPLDE